MKKSALALAVTAALGVSAAAQADTTLYGSARVSVDWNDPGKAGSTWTRFGVNEFGNPVFLGSFNLGPRNIDPNLPRTVTANPLGLNNSQFWQVFDDDSRLGVRGSEDLGGGLSAIYQYEFGVNVVGGVNDFSGSSRPKWVGLQGGFGAITLGTQYTPYYNVIGYTDTFNSSKTFGQDYFLGSSSDPISNTANMQQAQSIINDRLPFQKGVAAKRKGYSVVYTTPNWYGLSLQGLVQMNGIASSSNQTCSQQPTSPVSTYNQCGQSSPTSIDSWEANISYANGPWFAGFAFLQAKDAIYQNGVFQTQGGANNVNGPVVNGPNSRHTDNQYGVALGFDNKQFAAAFSWQMYNPGKKNIPFWDNVGIINGQFQTIPGYLVIGHENVNTYTGQLSYTFGNEILRVSYSWLNPSNIDAAANILEAGFQHNLSKRTRLWVEYMYDQIAYPNITFITANGVTDKNTLNRITTKNANENTVSIGIRHDF
jgi:predicted porin